MTSNHSGQLRFESLFFDLDGTLVDSLPGIAYSLEQAFKVCERVMLQPVVREMIGPPIPTIIAQLSGCTDDQEILDLVAAFRTSYDSKGWTKTLVFPEVRDTLQSLAEAGAQLYVFTNKPTEIAKRIIFQCGLGGLLQEIRSRDSRVPAYLSKAEMLRDMMERDHIDKHHSAVVGDSLEDSNAAKMLDQQFFFASYGYGEIEFKPFDRKTVIISKFGDLLGHCIGAI